MSHFSVAVLSSTEEVDELLEPFAESPSNDEYLAFVPADEDECRREYAANHATEYGTYDEFMQNYHGCTQNEEGEYGYLTNPDAKWDWYVVGGRWDGYLRLKDGTRCNAARIRDIDFSPDPETYARAVRFWEIHVEGQPVNEGEDAGYCMYKPEYYLKQYGTKEQFAADEAACRSWAILTPNGEWYERGTMGWFGFNDATMESRTNYSTDFDALIAENPDLYITIVDCHI